MKNENTSKSVASKASKILKDPNSSADEKAVAASALTQVSDAEKERNVDFWKQCKEFSLKSIVNHEQSIEFNQRQIEKHREMIQMIDERLGENK